MSTSHSALAIWGRLTKPRRPPAEEDDGNFYYSTALGPVEGQEGTGYIIPSIADDSFERTEFIPLDYAKRRLQSVSQDATRVKEAYDKHLSELQDYFQALLSQRKEHYESIIRDMKQKALRHVEIQKQMRQQSEEKLQKELKQNEDAIEELRDSMASLNREYQEEVRSLKNTLAESSSQLRQSEEALREVQVAAECEVLVTELTFRVEVEHILRSSDDFRLKALAQYDQLQNDTAQRIGDEELRIVQLSSQQQREEMIRRECLLTLNDRILNVLEAKEVEKRSRQLAELQEELNRQKMVVQLSQDETYYHLDRLNSVVEDNNVDAAKAKDVRSKFVAVIDKIQRQSVQSEVRLCMSSLISQVLERHSLEIAAQSTLNAKNNDDVHAGELSSVVQNYEEKMMVLHRDFEEKTRKLKSKFNSVLKDLKTKANNDEVALCLNNIIMQIVESASPHVVAASATVVGDVDLSPATMKSSHENVPRATSDADSGLRAELQAAHAHQLILEQKISELETELSLKRTETNAGQSTETSDVQLEKTIAPITGVAVKSDTEIKELEKSLEEMRRQEAEMQAQAVQMETAMTQLHEALARLSAEKDVCKNDIKEWTKAFEEENGREPDVKDKATVKDKYQKYKALSGKVKELEGKAEAGKEAQESHMNQLQELRQRINDTEIKISELNSRVDVPAQVSRVSNDDAKSVIPGPSAATSAAYVLPAGDRQPVVDSAAQTDESFGARSRGVPTVNGAVESTIQKDGLSGDKLLIAELQEAQQSDAQTIEQLEDQLYQIRQDYEATLIEKEKNDKERDFLKEKLDMFVKEKRTDVVKRFEDEVEALRQSQTTLTEQVASLSAEKTKNEMKIAELKDRAETAEKELKDRDDTERKNLSENQEKYQLKGQISKQRETIILKSKAATAGWDAAANADERFDVEVERAYKKGLAEERDRHRGDMDALNASIEKKEARITELLVSVTEMEKKMMENDAAMASMQQQMEAMKLEVADTIAGLSQMARGDGEDGEAALGPTSAELESAREELDAAQEELVTLMERCDRLEIELEQARRKNRILEKLAEITGLTDKEKAKRQAQAAAVPAKGSGGGGKKEVSHDMEEIIGIIKKSIVKGTSLWKSNRKDECYELYYEACVDCHNRLLTAEIRNPLNDAMNNGKVLGQQNKQRGAVVLRKALDKVLSDADKPALREAEDKANAELKSKAEAARDLQTAQNNEQVEELVTDLEELENSFLEQGYTKERNPSNSNSAGDVVPSPRESDNSAASMLSRAKNAEAMVASLKKQLAAVMQASASAPTSEPTLAAPVAGDAAPVAGDVKRGSVVSVGGRRVSTIGGGADPAEVRKLNRKIKELEAQLKSGAVSGGSGGATDAKAQAMQEKAMQKKLKDIETANKRESKALEMRATKAENALKKINATHGSIVAERDKLRGENAKLVKLTSEVDDLRSKAERFGEVEAALADRMAELDVLQDQFKKETALRKKYKNELEDLKGAIRVYARCRPMAKYELERGCKQVVRIKDDTGLSITTNRGEKDFEFDAVFSPTSTQEQVFEDTQRLVESCMDGFNVCLFAYGQTGSGKTFTMTGSPQMPGLTPRAIDELFRLIAERKHLQVKVTTYFIELYNDNLVDLYWVLDNKDTLNAEPPKLDIKMDNKKMVYIRNAVIKEAYSPEDLMNLFNTGNLERHTGATKMNAESSRSHSIFAIMVDSYDTATRRSTTGKLSLVDLAGSERADKTGASADRLKEAQNINKSLSALGDVIAALSEGTKFIPYRNNKLTQLMQDSLGGNAKTLMFVNFSPADYNADETSTSLMYASRVKKIVNNASKQAESEEVARLKAIIKRLQAGQVVDDDVAEDEGPPPPDDDGKVYDGY